MYAVLVAAGIESGREDDAKSHLEKNVIPAVRQAPGAVAGYWLAPQGGQGYATILFDSQEHAQAAADEVPNRAPDFVTINLVQVQEVAAHF